MCLYIINTDTSVTLIQCHHFSIYISEIVLPEREVEEKLKEDQAQKNDANGECCVCPKSKEETENLDKQRQNQIKFENYLQNMLYKKR